MSSKEFQQAKERFDRDGYTVVRGLFSSKEIDGLNRRVEWYVKNIVPGLTDRDVFYEDPSDPTTLKQLEHMNTEDDYFENYMADSRFIELGELLLDGPIRSTNQQWFNKPPTKSSPTPAHQDGHYFSIEPNEAVNMWLALDDVDEENGCLRYVVGSHRRGLRPHGRTDTLGFSQGLSDWGPDDDDTEISATGEAGDLIAHHSLMIHRADRNRSRRQRRALGGIYYSARSTVNDEAHRKYLDELQDLMEEKTS
jgi:phytanoyl-CoA hydroxylase